MQTISQSNHAWPLPPSALKPALTLALAIEHAPMGILMLRNQESGTLQPVIGEGLQEEAWQTCGSALCSLEPITRAFAQNARYSVRDIMEDGETRLRPIAEGLGWRAMDVVPLRLTDDSVIGAVAALFKGVRRPRERSSALAEELGRLLALALDNARVRHDSEKRRATIEELSHARMQFVARMSHELRTPLQSITGYIDLLALANPDPLTPRQRRMLERMRVGERVLARVIDDLVGMARLEAGRLSYDLTDIAGHSAVSAAAVIIQPLAEQKHLRLEVVGGGAGVVLRADETKLRQILINLLANAVKFTPDGGKVRVVCRADGNEAVFEVWDTGEGIPDSKIESAFQPYVQLGNQSSRMAGSGLGLAISREFAHGMGGSLTARSAPERGSVFTLRLPRVAS